ncbi:hypothetical protein Slala03_23960 [Streptomyces lavendulae subsp. lavendulae]|uniref:hypothetical protein n=1 Tax=Streptomyces lavendulae TaxID=1914 RepID=UPI0024A5CA41|nr:hypothetical protein [Streptomyces lavendulae]GLV82707.1 hypothetical protein Slala03_23960 [Streptomyces lavendulae subsp. lavendulae]
MSEQPSSPHGAQSLQRLGALKGLNPEEAAFAQHLRDLREDLGMSSTEIVTWLKKNEPEAAVDATRLSRFLSGANLPQPPLLPALHRLLAERGAADPERVREGWNRLYAAAQTKGPLFAREYKEQALRIALEEERVRTAQELAGLREEIAREREHRERLEGGLADVFDQPSGTPEQVRDLEEELEGVTLRIEELEDLVRQHEALLRLQRSDAERAGQALRETSAEIDVWRGNATPWTDDPEAIARAVAAFRDEGEDEQADGLLGLAARDLPVAALPELYTAFRSMNRPLEPARLSRSIGAQRKAKDIIQLTAAAVRAPSADGERPIDPPARWAQEVLVEAGSRAPVRELILLARLLGENGRIDEKRHLVQGVNSRTADRVEIATSSEFRGLLAQSKPKEPVPEGEVPKRRWFHT